MNLLIIETYNFPLSLYGNLSLCGTTSITSESPLHMKICLSLKSLLMVSTKLYIFIIERFNNLKWMDKDCLCTIVALTHLRVHPIDVHKIYFHAKLNTSNRCRRHAA